MTENNWDLIPKNDLSQNAMGGTELMLRRLYDGRVPRELLEKVEIIPSRFRPDDLNSAKPWIWWEHNLVGDPESNFLADPQEQHRFDAFVFVSYWQAEKFVEKYRISRNKVHVIQNGIEPFWLEDPQEFRFHGKGTPDNPIRLIYHTTPHRGLQLLLPVYDFAKKILPDINFTLDIYSSFKVYGWEQRDEQFKHTFDFARTLDGVTVHETVSNEEIRQILTETDIFAYPSIWQETSCLAGIEAISAGNVVVTSSLAALPETLGRFPATVIYDYTDDIQVHCNRFAEALIQTINAIATTPEEAALRTEHSKILCDLNGNNWELSGCVEWEKLLRSILSR